MDSEETKQSLTETTPEPTTESLKDSSANADYQLPVSLLSEKEIKALKLKLDDWKQYLEDEQTERNRTGVIGFIERKIKLYELRPEGACAEKMFELLKIEYENKGRRPPTHFPTTICKENFNAASVSLNGTFEAALRAAIGGGITAIPRIVSYISSPKWQENTTNERGTKGSTQSRQSKPYGNQGSSQKTNFAPAAGSGQSAETTARLEAAFAPKP